jgi:hypothetical protein
MSPDHHLEKVDPVDPAWSTPVRIPQWMSPDHHLEKVDPLDPA